MRRARLVDVGRALSSLSAPGPRVAPPARAAARRDTGLPVPTHSLTETSPQPLRAPKSAQAGIVRAVSEARRAVVVAKEDQSDDMERDQSTALARRAIVLYDAQLAKLDAGTDPELRDKFAAEVGPDVAALKDELFQSRKPRLWLAVSGWF
jgi:hypothetical protein